MTISVMATYVQVKWDSCGLADLDDIHLESEPRPNLSATSSNAVVVSGVAVRTPSAGSPLGFTPRAR